MSTDGRSQFQPITEPTKDILAENGGMPLKSSTPYYSDDTKRQLRAVGWTEGDPLPPNFGEALAAIRDEVAQETAKAYAELPEKMAGYVPPTNKIVDITTLPPAKQAEIRDWLAGYRNDVATLAAPQPAMQQPPVQAPVQQAPVQQAPVQQAPQPVSQPTPPPAPAPEPEAVSSTPTHCSRCQWPVNLPFNVVATEQDKQQFLISILSGESYQKQYDLLGGTVRLRLRSLSIPESTAINLQLGYMVRAGIISGNLEYGLHNMLFRTVLGVEELKAGIHVLYTRTPLETFAASRQPAGEHPTVLPEYTETVNKALKSEPVVQIINKTYREFQRLVELLEEKTGESAFWNGIVLQDS